MDYWSSFAQDWSLRLGVTGVLDDAVPEPVIALLNSTRLSDEEKERLRRQREDYYHDDSIRSVRITVSISLPIFLLSFCGFELMLRSRPTSFWRMLCVPRLVAAELSGASAVGLGQGSTSNGFGTNGTIPEVPPRQVWCHTADLMRKVLTVDDKKILECAGMDAVVLLRFCAMCGRFCAILCFWCLFLSPLYAAGANWWIIGPRQGLTRYTLANLRQGSNILWCAVPAAYLCTLTLCALLWKEYERFVMLRRSYLGGASVPRHEHGPGSPPAHTGESSIGAEIPFRRGVTPPPLHVSPLHGPLPPPLATLNASEVPEQASQGLDYEMFHTASIGAQNGPVGQPDLLEQTRRTVLVEGVPPEFSDPGVLRSHLEELLGANAVHSIAPVPADSRRLCELMELRSSLIQDRGSNWQELVQVEETLRGRREMFGRMVIASAFKDRRRHGSFGGPHMETGSFLSLGGEDDFTVEPTPRHLSNSLPHSNVMGSFLPSGTLDNIPPAGLYNPRARTTLSASGFQELCAAGRIAGRVAIGALISTASAIRAMAVELVGSSVRRVGQLVPTSALGTPGQSRVHTPGPSALGTPFGEGFFMDFGMMGTSRRFSSAFVTFRNLQTACIACQVTLEDAMMITGTTEMTVVPAPEPRDVVWRNAARPTSQRLMRSFGVEVALLLGLAFWSVPVGLLQAWCSLARLQNLLPWMHLTQQFVSSDVYALLTLYLPVMLLLLVLEVLPVGLHFVAMFYEGAKSHSALHLLTMRRYWRFQLATIFVTVLSGSVSDSLKTIVDHPPSFLWELGQSLPKVAVYFLVTVLSSALVVAPVSLLRLPTLALTAGSGAARMVCRFGAVLLGRRCWAQDENERGRSTPCSADAEALVDTPDLAADMSALLFVLLVCVTYATIAPFIMLAGLLFFVVKWQALALRYLYVCAPRFDSGGRFWYLLWDQALLALVLGNLTTLALVALRSGYGQLPFLIPLPFLPILFKMRAEQRFTEASLRLSLRSARTLDAQNPRVAERLSHDAYWHPALRIAEGDLRTVSGATVVSSTNSAPAGDRGIATSRREFHHWVHASRVLDAVEELQLGLESTTPSRCVSCSADGV